MTVIRATAWRALSIAACIVATARAAPIQHGTETVVVAELFTSEGCSSCPPADDLLRRLNDTQPVDGVNVVALSSHVDYWNRLGWRDPFSSALFSARQSAYAAAIFGSDRIYTPQLVVDGAFEVVGSDASAVRQTLLKAAAQPKAAVAVTATPKRDRQVQIDVRVEVPANVQRHGAADIVIAVTEDGLVSRVNGGENAGRTLYHAAVVRSLATAGHLKDDDHAASVTAAVTLAADWKLPNLRIVAFVQEKASRHIIGGGSSLLVQH